MKLNSDRVMSASAMLISLGTLFIILYQTVLTRKAQKASVMPYMQISLSLNDEEQRLHVANTGLGPAFIKSVEVINEDGSVYAGSPSRFAHEQLEEPSPFRSYSESLLVPGRLIPADELVVTFRHSTEGPNGDFIRQHFKFPYSPEGKFVLAIKYESVYGDRWLARSDEYAPRASD